MSGSSRRRLSKWDRRDSEPVSENFHDRDPPRNVSENFHDRDPPRKVSENFHDRDPPRKPREALSPSRGSHRHESRSRERMMTCDREENSIRISPGLDEWRHRHHSRSPPRNGRGRSYRSRSRSRSRSQSRSPAYNSRREYALTEKSRGKICRDFAAGRCRRANHCQFLHQDAQPYDTRRTVGSSPPDDWESRDPRSGGSRYSPDNPKDYPVRSERSVNLCNDFLKGRCRRGSSCRFSHHDASSDAFDRGPADDHRSRDTYHDRNHDREPSKRGETLCKFFAAGNCRNGNHCRFSHQVKEDFGPEMWSQDDRRGQDRKFDGSPAWDGPRWGDATRVSNVPTVQGWGEDKSEITEVPKQTWDAPGSIIDEPKTRDERQPLQWNTDNSVENLAGDMEISPRDVLKQTPSLPNISLPAVEQDIAGEAPYEKHYQSGFHEQKTFNDPYSGQNPDFKEDKPNIFLPEGRNSVGNNDFSCIPPNPPMKVQPEQSIFQSNQSGCQEQKPSNDPYNPNFKEDKPNLYPSEGRNAVGNNDFSCIPPNPPMNVQPVQSIFQKNLSGFQEQKGFNDPYSGFKEDKPNLYPPEGRKSVGNNDGSCIPPNPPMNVQQVQSVFQSNPFGFQEQKAFNDPYSGQNPNFKENNPNIYPPEGRNAAGNNDRSCIPPNPPLNVQPGRIIFQSNQSGFQEQKEFNDPYSGQNPNFKDDKPNLYPPEGRNAAGNNDRSLNVQPGHVNLQPVSSTNSLGGQGQLLFPLHPSAGDTMQLSTTNAHMNVNVQPMSTSINPVAGQGQLPLTLHPCGGNEMQTSHNPSSFLDNTTSGQLSATVTNHNSVSSEQLAQLSHLSASLAQLLESRQQLPQPSSAVTVPPVSETLKQYDPVGDSIELKMPDSGNHTLPSLVEQKTSDNDNVNQQELHLASKDDENGGKIDEGGSKERENRPSEDVAADDGADDGKKPKDAKGIRSFKFALADFIKELLKPTWKDGQVSKEAYKAIVKKVVDKVIETQGAQIPQTKEKIDQYLSCSKPKLEKLVQAYVGKFQKS